MDEKYEVHPSSAEALKEILVAKSAISPGELDNKLHIRYFEDYFQEIGAQTIVVENDYVDHDYLEDHAEYYVRCFQDYKRKCTRLHIFKTRFSIDDFERLLKGDEEGLLSTNNLQDEYLGFVVVKPLPKTIIGRTCLTTYPSEGTPRSFPITRSYTANLFGIPLKVESSLAFQEQDTVVAACATSALWSIFQGTGKLFQHAIPSPSVITKAATEHITDSERTRAFPSKGLDVIEMARAIKNIDLEPYPVKVTNDYVLKSTVYAYLRMGIPMLFGFPLYDTAQVPNGFMGKHAVALAGYNLPDGEPVPGPNGFRLRASRINKLYAHDDQVGPFARMVFDGVPIVVHDEDDNPVQLGSISTSWKGSDGVIGSARILPEILLLPLYHKIRIPFGCINDQIMEFDLLVQHVFDNITEDFGEPSKYEWDIYLTTVNEFKSELLLEPSVTEDDKKSILIAGMPKYIWRATIFYGQEKVLDILFDATDLEQGSYVIVAIGYHGNFKASLKSLVTQQVVEDTFANSMAWPIVQSIREYL